MRPPEISHSTKEERAECIKNMFPCHADCDSCGICQMFHGKDPEVAYTDYIEGKREFFEVTMDYR